MSSVHCTLCPNDCMIFDNERGVCRARYNIDGELYSLVYGKPCAVHVDPIEKKPSYHFLPGSKSFSIATAGCCLSCKYCQNWQISQANPEDAYTYDLPPKKVVSSARASDCRSIAYTYTEPTIFYEYMIDTARLAREQGIANVYVTCGYINKEPLAELQPYIDLANVDLKGFSEEFYESVTGGQLQPVLDTIKYLYSHGTIVELTNLIVPTLNDDIEQIKKMCAWIVEEVSPDIPIHFARFYPHYMLQSLPPTPVSTLRNARDAACAAGMYYVYVGNVREEAAQNTRCPQCRTVVVERMGYLLQTMKVNKEGACPTCGFKIYGTWA